MGASVALSRGRSVSALPELPEQIWLQVCTGTSVQSHGYDGELRYGGELSNIRPKNYQISLGQILVTLERMTVNRSMVVNCRPIGMLSDVSKYFL